MQGDAKSNNGHRPNPGLDDPPQPSGGDAGGLPVDGDRITGLLNALYTSVAAQPLSAQLQDLVDRLLAPVLREDPETAPECGDEAPAS